MTDYSDDFLRDILKDTKTIAAVGVSANPVRPSYFVARYMSLQGYRVIPVNPGLAGQRLFGQMVYPDLESIPRDAKVQMVDVFRRSEAIPPIAQSAIDHLPDLRVFWMQIGVQHEEAAASLRSNGISVVENRCPKIERQRLFGELRKAGFNTGVISSRM